MSQIHSIVITCPKGITPYLKQEVEALNLPVLEDEIAAVHTEGSFHDIMRLNLYLRAGHRVLMLLKSCRARNADDLYKQTVSIPWEEYIDADGYVSVSSSVLNDSIRDTRFANLKCKDAIVDRIKRVCGRRPDSGGDQDRTVVYLYWHDETCLIYLDTSGEPLSRRGYRKNPFKAPMQETLAAAVIQAMEWNGKNIFINPMCGSGTLAIEAALKALNRPAGLLRENFGFMHIKGFQKAAWNTMRKKGDTGHLSVH